MDVGTPPQRLAPPIVLRTLPGDSAYLTFATSSSPGPDAALFLANESTSFREGVDVPYLGTTGKHASDVVSLNGISARQELGAYPTPDALTQLWRRCAAGWTATPGPVRTGGSSA